MLQRDSARRKIEAAFETRRPLSRPFEMDLPKAVHPVSPAAVVPSAPVSGGIMKTKGLVHDASGAKSLAGASASLLDETRTSHAGAVLRSDFTPSLMQVDTTTTATGSWAICTFKDCGGVRRGIIAHRGLILTGVMFLSVALLAVGFATWKFRSEPALQRGIVGMKADSPEKPQREPTLSDILDGSHPLDILGRNAAAQNAKRDSYPFLLGRTNERTPKTPSVNGSPSVKGSLQ